MEYHHLVFESFLPWALNWVSTMVAEKPLSRLGTMHKARYLSRRWDNRRFVLDNSKTRGRALRVFIQAGDAAHHLNGVGLGGFESFNSLAVLLQKGSSVTGKNTGSRATTMEIMNLQFAEAAYLCRGRATLRWIFRALGRALMIFKRKKSLLMECFGYGDRQLFKFQNTSVQFGL